MSRISKDEYYLNLAKEVSRRSTCLKRQYGAVIVNQDEVVATGYNGPPRTYPHCNTCKRLQTPSNGNNYDDCESVHAEMNAIISASRREMIGSTMYLFGFQSGQVILGAGPCKICRRLIKNAGIKRIVSFNEKGEIKDEYI